MDENKTNTPYGRSNTPYMNPVYAQGVLFAQVRSHAHDKRQG